jgi:hypothetical protein
MNKSRTSRKWIKIAGVYGFVDILGQLHKNKNSVCTLKYRMTLFVSKRKKQEMDLS